jgi:cellulose synthase/poly-beta-1,6-N-acetylglucosamine synthase-like glycosyltransferase
VSLSSFHPRVSVVIKTYDDAPTATSSPRRSGGLRDLLATTLQAIERQTLHPHEVHVVDSSVGDGIAEVISNHVTVAEFPIRRVALVQERFSHPRALNVGIQNARGDVIVSLSGDATPANELWLEKLVAPLADPEVAGAYSRQIARPGASLSWAERFRLWWRYRPRSMALRSRDHLFSNACSAFRRELALRIPFNETLVEVEDYEWAREVQRQGYTIAYVGDSEVFHSHTASSVRTVWRMIRYTYLRMRVDTARLFDSRERFDEAA